MYCPNCGNQVNDNAVVCVHCGAAVGNNYNYSYNPEHQTSKTGIGVLLALVLGLIGLVIGLLLYPSNTVARNTFIKGWAITFIISFAVGILFVILYFAFVFSLLGIFV